MSVEEELKKCQEQLARLRRTLEGLSGQVSALQRENQDLHRRLADAQGTSWTAESLARAVLGALESANARLGEASADRFAIAQLECELKGVGNVRGGALAFDNVSPQAPGARLSSLRMVAAATPVASDKVP